MLQLKKKGFQSDLLKALISLVGMERFELSAPRPPDEYSNLAELHPGGGCVFGCEVWVWVWLGVQI